MRTHQGGADGAPTPANDIAALQNEQVVYVPNKYHRNPSREVKHHPELLKDYWGYRGIGWPEGQDLRCVNQQPWGQKKLPSISPFQDYPIILKTFIKADVTKMSNKFLNKIQTISNHF